MIEKARELKRIIDAQNTAIKKLIRIDELTDDELEELVYLYDDWYSLIGESLAKGETVRYKGILYKTMVDIEEVKEQFNPAITNYQYVEVRPAEVIPEWFPVRGYQDALERVKGFKMIYKGKVYESLIDNNSQEPTKDEPYNRYWKEVVE